MTRQHTRQYTRHNYRTEAKLLTMKLSQCSHIAIIQTAFLGDTALALYLAQEIRNLHPTCTLSFVTTPLAAPLVQCAQAVDEVMSFDKRQEHKGWKGMRTIAATLQAKKVDTVIALQRSARSSIVAALSGAKHRVGFSTAGLSLLYTHRKEWQLHRHETERNRSLLSCFEEYVRKGAALPSVHLTLQDYQLPFSGKPVVALAPGSVWATKRWQPEQYQQSAMMLRERGYGVVLIGGKDDVQLCADIAATTGAISLAGECSLPQTLSLLRQCQALISNDSAPVHLAGLVGCRTIAIFGSTIPAFGFAPLGAQDVVLENTELSCRPCGIHGRKSCPLQTMKCMSSITPAMVVEPMIGKTVGDMIGSKEGNRKQTL